MGTRGMGALGGVLGLVGCAGGADTGACAAPVSEIAGVVVDEVGTLGPAPGAEVRLTALDRDAPVLTTKTDEEGRFRLTPAPGRYQVDAAGTNGCFTEGGVGVPVPGCGIDGLELRLTICSG